MKIEGLIDAVFIQRENRFAATVLLCGRRVYCHVPNSGRLGELLTAGVPVRVKPARPGGRTECRLELVWHAGAWVAVDAHLANDVAHEAVLAGIVPGLGRIEKLKREVTKGASRFDMACAVDGRPCFIEVKCCTLCVGGVGLFPDAPTARGARHLRELGELSQGGALCYVLFVLQNPAAQSISPNHATDPEFAGALAQAHASGVRVYALTCKTGPSVVTAIRAVELSR